MIKNIVFDLGGVIFGLNREEAVKSFTKIGIKDANERLDAFSQKGIFEEFELGNLDVPTFNAKLEKLAGHQLTPEVIRHCWLSFVTGVPTYKLDYLTQLRQRGYKVYILSNTNPYVWGWANSSEFSSYGLPLSHYADATFASYKIRFMKPDIRMFQTMLTETKVQANECLFIDDGAANIKAAQKLGFHTILASNNGDFRNDIEEFLND